MASSSIPSGRPSSQELRGRFGQVLYRNEATGSTLARFQREATGEWVVVSGPFTEEDLRAREVTLWGFVAPGKRGPIFRVREIWRGVAHDLLAPPAEGVAKLCVELLHGMGPAAARKITDAFGADTWQVLTREPYRLAEVIGLERALAYHQALVAFGLPQGAALAHLMGLGLSYAYAERALRAFGTSGIAQLALDPYRLVGVPGIKFSTADRIAQTGFGLTSTDPRRLRALAVSVLTDAADDGHTSLPRADVLQRLATQVDLTALGLTADDLVTQAVQQGILAEDHGDLYLPTILAHEREAVQHLAELLLRPARPLSIDVDQHPACAHLTTKQREAVREGLARGFVKIAGPAGSGKTTVLAAMVQLAQAMELPVTLAAPTGKAADRMNEALVAAGLGQNPTLFGAGIRPAVTLQSLVGNEGQGRALPEGLVAIDEDSMVDLALFARTVRNAGPRTTLVLFGDPLQLSSVMAGNVSRDLDRAASVPVVALDQVHRQGANTLLAVNAARVRSGRLPVFYGERLSKAALEQVGLRRVDPATVDMNCYTRAARTPMEGTEKVLDSVRRLRDNKGFDPIADIQVYSPMKRGVLGTNNLNRALQEELNPTGERLKPLYTLRFRALPPVAPGAPVPADLPKTGYVPRAGDTVELTKHDARHHLSAGARGTVCSQRADGGLRVRFGTETQPVELEIPAAHVPDLAVVYEYWLKVGDPVLETRNEKTRGLSNGMRGIVRGRSDDGGVVVDYQGRLVSYPPSQLGRLRPAYALTNHKGQGTECRASIVAMHQSEHHVMLDRSLFYVGLTRAKELFIYVGTPFALRVAMHRTEGQQRHTRFPDRLDARVTALAAVVPTAPTVATPAVVAPAASGSPPAAPTPLALTPPPSQPIPATHPVAVPVSVARAVAATPEATPTTTPATTSEAAPEATGDAPDAALSAARLSAMLWGPDPAAPVTSPEPIDAPADPPTPRPTRSRRSRS